MDFTSRERQGVLILEIIGRITLNQGAKELYSIVRRELDHGTRGFLLDLSRTTLVDSTGLGVLVTCLTSAKTRGVALKLLRPSPKVEDILKITQTDRLFEIFEDESLALASFEPSAT